MSVGKVTTRVVDAMKPAVKDRFLWDNTVAGFGVRVTPGGAKSYIYQYRLGGRASVTQRYTIGRHRSPWTAQTARSRAQRLAKQVGKGKDPVAKRRDRRRKEAELRFDKYVELFAEQYLKHRWKDWERVRTQLRRYAVPTLRSKKLSHVTRADLAEVYRRLGNLPSVARALHAALRKLFRWAMSRDDLKYSPVDGVEPPRPIQPRTRYLSEGELAAAWKASFEVRAVYGSLFRLLILTGQRRGEVAGLRWSELAREEGVWTLPAERSKNRHAHLVPLSAATIAEFDSLAGGDQWPREGLVLQSASATPLSAFSKMKNEWDRRISRILKTRGYSSSPHWRLHDIRRSVATGMQTLQIRTEIIEAVLNHVSGTRAGLVGVYQRYDFQAEKCRAMDAWAKHVVKLHADLCDRIIGQSLEGCGAANI